MLHGSNWSFIHIPKCGGTALRQYLEGFEYGDLMPLGKSCAIKSRFHRIAHRRPRGRVFSVVRHPASWLRSFWLDQSPSRIEVSRYLHQYWANDLDEFVFNVCTESPGYVGKLYNAHLRYRSIKVFRLENGLDPIFAWIGISVQKIAAVNVSPTLPRLSKESIALVERSEQTALRRFRYAT